MNQLLEKPRWVSKNYTHRWGWYQIFAAAKHSRVIWVHISCLIIVIFNGTKNCFTKRWDKKKRKKNYFLTLDGKWINGVPFESWYCHVLCVLYALNCFHKHECHVNLYRFQNAKNSADRKTVIKEQKPIDSRANNISIF